MRVYTYAHNTCTKHIVCHEHTSQSSQQHIMCNTYLVGCFTGLSRELKGLDLPWLLVGCARFLLLFLGGCTRTIAGRLLTLGGCWSCGGGYHSRCARRRSVLCKVVDVPRAARGSSSLLSAAFAFCGGG